MNADEDSPVTVVGWGGLHDPATVAYVAVRVFAIAVGILLVVIASILIPRLANSPDARVDDGQRSAIVTDRPQAAAPFAGWNPDVERWAAEYHWGTMHDLSVKWSDTPVTQVTPAK